MYPEADCVFCQKVRDGDYTHEWDVGVVNFEPLNPVTPGHMLFIPTYHAEHPHLSAIADCMSAAEFYAAKMHADYNLITSSGPSATQTIAHLHVHYVPRRAGDGLHLPWTGQKV